jgi:hypothetical protein
MYISPSEALRIYDVSRPTLYKDMSEGNLSFDYDDRKRRRINVAELDRVYKKRPSGDQAQTSQDVQPGHGYTELNVKQPSHEVERLRQQVEFLEHALRARSEDTERWREAFDRAQSTADKITALLEDRSAGARQGGDHDKHIELLTKMLERQSEAGRAQDEKITTLEKTLEEVRQQNKRVLHEIKKREEAKDKKAAEENENKSFIKRFFG